jgi:hypothetical protein
VTLLSSAHQCGDTRDSDDSATARRVLLSHLVRYGLHGVEGAIEVDVLNTFPKGGREVEEGVERADTGIRDEDVYSGESRHARLNDLGFSFLALEFIKSLGSTGDGTHS